MTISRKPIPPFQATSEDATATAALSHWRLALLRGTIWGLHGMIYAPLFTGLTELLKSLGVGAPTPVIAATITGTITAVLYGAREISLMSSGIGAAIGVLLLIVLTGPFAFLQTILIAAVVAAIAGLTIRFPTRCATHVAPKALSGLAAGTIGGLIVMVTERQLDAPLSLSVVLAILVSVNGLLYVLTLRWWVAFTDQLCNTIIPCYIAEAFIMALLASVAAGSVWLVSGPLTNAEGLWWQTASLGMHAQLVPAIVGGIVGGSVAGMIFELFRLSWVSDL
ncbi:hypothetical protein [Chromatium okenii]|uniref:hypothetical protein n=1 Tax=Chromatium okenii TaxID=61644 RepID=UPI001F5B0DC5|nr:hypothetical protein [Chromatium okenii]